MADWPSSLIAPQRVIITPNGTGQPLGQHRAGASVGTAAAAAWPAVNRALYLPVLVETTVLATQIVIYIGAQAGNVDVGIYDGAKRRLVSTGSTAVGAAGLQLLNITDTTLTPGNYWLGMVCSTTTTLTLFRLAPTLMLLQTSGVQQEALGATTLPATATFANPANSYAPVIGAMLDLAA